MRVKKSVREEGPRSTEEKILGAARKIFIKKGFSDTRTRDISEEAGINLALLNYYFRSKKKLFDVVMQEKIQTLLQTIIPVLKDPETNLGEKVEGIVSNYIRVLSENPDLPIFVLNELNRSNEGIMASLPPGKVLLQSSFIMQLKEKRPDIDPIQFLISLLGLTVFPFVARPILMHMGIVNEISFLKLMKQREELIPLWIESIINAGKKN